MKTKIFFILPSIGFGGAEKVYIEVATALSNNKKYCVELIYLTSKEKERVLPRGLRVKAFKVSSTKAGFFKVLKYIKEKEPNYVFSSHTHLNIMMVTLKKLFNLQFKLYLRHTFNLSTLAENKKGLLLKLHKLYRFADGVIFQSNYMQKDFTEIIPIQNSYIIGNPINIEYMEKMASEQIADPVLESQNQKKFLFLGRLTKVKNVDYLIHAFNKYKNKKASKLIIIGDGNEKEQLQKLIIDLKLQENVKIYNVMTNPFPYVKGSDALFLCSNSEGFPNVIIESLGLGTPVFVRKHKGGTKQVMENLGLSKYFLDEIDFDNIEGLLEFYPKNIIKKTNSVYGIDSVVQRYEQIIQGGPQEY